MMTNGRTKDRNSPHNVQRFERAILIGIRPADFIKASGRSHHTCRPDICKQPTKAVRSLEIPCPRGPSTYVRYRPIRVVGDNKKAAGRGSVRTSVARLKTDRVECGTVSSGSTVSERSAVRISPFPLVRISVFARVSLDTIMRLPFQFGSAPMVRKLCFISVVVWAGLGIAHAQSTPLTSIHPSGLPTLGVGPSTTFPSVAAARMPVRPTLSPWSSSASAQPAISSWTQVTVGSLAAAVACLGPSGRWGREGDGSWPVITARPTLCRSTQPAPGGPNGLPTK